MRDPGSFGLAHSTASKHLKIIEEAGLIPRLKEGLWVNYRLSEGSSSPFAASLLENMRHWLEDDSEITAIMDRLPEIKRENSCGNWMS